MPSSCPEKWRGGREAREAWMRARREPPKSREKTFSLSFQRYREWRRRKLEIDSSDIALRFPVYWFCWRAQCRMAYRRGT